jgi:N-acetylneuraminic acid mutarotase
VEDSLRLSNALEAYWGQPITGAQLQAEIERQARDSRQPEVLVELWAALHNDPQLIAETLARPALAERLARNWYENGKGTKNFGDRSFDDWWRSVSADLPVTLSVPIYNYTLTEIATSPQAQNRWSPTHALPEANSQISGVWTGTEMIIWGGTEIGASKFNSGSRYNPSTDTWRTTSGVQAPDVRKQHSAVWTGTEMIVWGGCGPLDEHSCQIATGGRYNPMLDSWQRTSTVNAPAARINHTAVWTGSEMIVFGGCSFSNDVCRPENVDSTGGRYNPATNSWQATSTANAPGPRQDHTAVWTGTEMIVWGGQTTTSVLNDGGRYNPANNTWVTTNPNAAPSARYDHSAVWTGSRMIVWGGTNGSIYFNDGGRYDPVADNWEAVATAGAPVARAAHTAVWSGTEMIVWGGCSGSFCTTKFDSGGRYNSTTNSWLPTSQAGAPVARSHHVAVWTGSLMVVWGGSSNGDPFTGGRYNPSADSWTPTNANKTASAREYFTSVWTGAEMIVWGGDDRFVTQTDTGARYNPALDNWQPTSQTGAPTPRHLQTAVWTGSEMIVWGGGSGSTIFKTGGRYNPVNNTWTPTSTTGAPEARSSHTAVWTGTEMIVWGGSGLTSPWIKTGGRYNPSTNGWTATTLTNAPIARSSHVAVWSGQVMIVWGGATATFDTRTGGRYDPATNTWSATSLVDAPSERHLPAAIWTGNKMLVWGGQTYNGTYSYHNTGGLYDPATDAWVSTSIVNAPTPRAFFAYVWTGTQMIVWAGCPSDPFGGEDCFGGEGVYTGGQYTPSTDSWRPTAVRGAPGRRYSTKGVWTGTEMIAWGGIQTDSDTYTWTGGGYRPPQ